MFTVSMTVYLSFVCGIVYHVFEQWYQYTKKAGIQVDEIEYKPGRYDFCNINQETDATYAETSNFRNWISYIPTDYKRKSILVISIILFLFHLIEVIFHYDKVFANLHSFITGYTVKYCNTNDDYEGAIPLEKLKDKIEEAVHQKSSGQRLFTEEQSRWNLRKTKNILLSCVGVLYITSLLTFPQFFYLLEVENKTIEGKTKSEALLIKLKQNECFIISDSWSCKSETNQNCIFPFLLDDGTETDHCVRYGLDKKLRCALDSNHQGKGMLSSHEVCGPTCPGGKWFL